jgi:hypothetical protein
VYTHKATREGRSVWISIFGLYGEKFARRIAENALKRGEWLSAEVVVTTDRDGQRFTYTVEQETLVLEPSIRHVDPRRHLTPDLILALSRQETVVPQAVI